MLLFMRVYETIIQTTTKMAPPFIKTAAAASERRRRRRRRVRLLLPKSHHPTKIVVVGTNHNSASDAEKVTRVIEDVEPDVVVVELDFERMNSFFERFFMQRRRIPKGGGDFMNAV